MTLILREGDRYSRWTVVETVTHLSGRDIWHYKIMCRCDCGETRRVDVQSLVHLRSRNCKGCSSRERLRKHDDSNNGSGEYRRLYRIWQGMKKRCYSQSEPNYQRYGARGITICDEWRNDYLAFRAWALANGYRDDLTLDRINNEEGYFPENCRWATPAQQSRNMRRNRLISAFGESKIVADWANDPRCRVCFHTLATRIDRNWSHEWAITAPVRSPKRPPVNPSSN